MGEPTTVIMAAQALTAAGLYVWISLALMAVFGKAGQAGGKAWVPVLNSWTLFVMGGMRGWWAVVVAGAAALASIASAAIIGVMSGVALNASFEGDTAGAQAALSTATVVPSLLALAVLAASLALHVRMLIGVNRAFGLGASFTVLGALVFPVWASIVGWGSARWLGRAPAASGPGAASAPPTAEPAAPVVPALADFSRTQSGGPDQAHTPFAHAPSAASPAPFAAPTPFAQAPAAFVASPTPVAASPDPTETVAGGGQAWAPPSPAEASLGEASPPAPEGDAAPAAVAAPRAQWSLVLPSGDSAAMTGDVVVLGRNPVAPAHAPGAQPIAIDDLTRTVSKTHALLLRSPSGWTISDLDSTNGVFIGASPESATEVVGSAPVEGAFLLGDAVLSLRWEA